MTLVLPLMNGIPKLGSSPVEWVLYSVVVALIATGVGGLIFMAVNVGKLEERVGNWTRTFEERFVDMDKRYERRLDGLDENQKVLRRYLKVPQL